MAHQIIPRVMVSAASADLRSARRFVSESLNQIGCLPVEESLFGTEYGPIPEMQKRIINSCDAVIHLVGPCYGNEPNPKNVEEGKSRRSWTQMEFDDAVSLEKKLFVIICNDGFPFDEHTSEPAAKVNLQAAHRSAVMSSNFLWKEISSEAELREAVLAIKVPAEKLKEAIANLQKKQSRRTWLTRVGILLLLSILSPMFYFGYHAWVDARFVRQLYDNPEALKERLINEVRQRAKEKIDKLDPVDDWRKIEELKNLQVEAESRIPELLDGIIRQRETNNDADLKIAMELFAKKGIAETIGFLEAKQSSIFAKAKSLDHKTRVLESQKREVMQAMILKADLHLQDLEVVESINVLEKIIAISPSWSEARLKLGDAYRLFDRIDDAEEQYQRALDASDNNLEKVKASRTLGEHFRSLGNYGKSQPLLEQALHIDTLTEESEKDSQLSRAESLKMLGGLYLMTDRAEQAERFYHESISLELKHRGEKSVQLARARNGLALLCYSQGRFDEAADLFEMVLKNQSLRADSRIKVHNMYSLVLKHQRKALEARKMAVQCVKHAEAYFGPRHSHTSGSLNSLALHCQNPAVAGLLERRGMGGFIFAYGESNYNISISLDNLAQSFLLLGNQDLPKALYLKSIRVSMNALGEEHSDVGRTLANFSGILTQEGNIDQARLLLNHALQIFNNSTPPNSAGLGICLQQLGRISETELKLKSAKQILYAALAIHEGYHGTKHVNVALDLSLLSRVLVQSGQEEAAVLAIQRSVEIYRRNSTNAFEETPGLVETFQYVLQSAGISQEEIQKRLTAEISNQELQPISPDLRPLLGPHESVAHLISKQEVDETFDLPRVLDQLGPDRSVEELLVKIDECLVENGIPASFLDLDLPISEHLDEIIK